MNFFAELRRRNVFRVGGVYAVVGWLLIQVIVAVKGPLHLPGWTDTFFVVLVLAGFPIALLLAWAFELTPEGVKLTKNVAEGESIAAKTGRKLDYAILAGLALVGLMIIADRLTPSFETRPSAAPQDEDVAKGPSDASIAVLPFEDLSQVKDQQYFSDGVAEEILNVLAQVKGLTVASRTSSFQYRDKAIGAREIAKELGVRHLLEGSVRKAGDEIRVTAQLIDAATDAHLWSEDFDRPLTATNVFKIQDEIAAAIVDALRQRLGVKISEAAPRAAQTESTKAYDLFLHAHELFINRGQGLKDAVLLYEQAIRADPNFSRAWAELAAAAAVAPGWGVSDRDYKQIAQGAAAKALELDPNQAIAYAAQAETTLQMFPLDLERARANLDRALVIDPRNVVALNWRATLDFTAGDLARAVEGYRKCLEIDPGYLICESSLGLLALAQGKTDEAISGFTKLILKGFAAEEFEFIPPLLERGDRTGAAAVALAGAGDAHLAAQLIEALSKPSPAERTAALLPLRTQVKGPSWFKSFLELQTALAQPITGYRSISLNFFYVWLPEYADYRRNEDFKKMATAAGLPAYWREHGFPPFCRPIGDDDFECR